MYYYTLWTRFHGRCDRTGFEGGRIHEIWTGMNKYSIFWETCFLACLKIYCLDKLNLLTRRGDTGKTGSTTPLDFCNAPMSGGSSRN